MASRILFLLPQSGIAQSVAAICIGAFTPSSGVAQATLEEIISLTVPPTTPVVTNLAFGHGDPLFTVPIGREATLDLEKDHCSLTFEASTT